MNRETLRYKTYKALLESNLTNDQREKLLEAGILDKVMDFFGAGKDTLTKFGGGLKTMFSDAKYARSSATAKKNIEKELNDLKAVAKSAGQDESVVYQILNMILTDAGVDPKTVANPPKVDAGGGDKGGAPAGGTPSGTPVKAGDSSATPTLAAAAGEAAGKDPAKAAAVADDKKVAPEKATEVLGKAISSKAGVDPKAGIAVVKALIDTGHLVAEGMYRLTASDVKRALNEIRSVEQTENIFERWQSLSGLLIEKNKENKAMKDAMRKSGSLAGKTTTGTGSEKMAAAKAAQEKYAAGVKKGEAAKAAAQDKKNKPGAPSADKGTAPAGDKSKETAAAEKKFGNAFKAVKDKVKDIDDDTIGKILTALDDLKAIEVK